MRRTTTTTLPMHRADRAREAAKAMRATEAAITFTVTAHKAARAAERESGAWADHAARARIAAVLADLRATRRELLQVLSASAARGSSETRTHSLDTPAQAAGRRDRCRHGPLAPHTAARRGALS